jgi:trehalose synthase
MQVPIEKYIDVVGDETIARLYRKAGKLYGKRAFYLNSTFAGGGVAEILDHLIPMLNEIGVDAGWRILHGDSEFFEVTKKMHNSLQGGEIKITPEERERYLRANEGYSRYTHITHDCVLVQDPQPLPLIRFYRKKQPWVWRCHIDIANPEPELWNFLKQTLLKYDMVIVSSDIYKRDDLPVEQRVIQPAIDPLCPKNADMSDADLARMVDRIGIPTDKPIVTQVSRMDPWKDPEGVLEVYKKVKAKSDCRLLFCYDYATDDPEGVRIHNKVREKAKDHIERGDVLFVQGSNDHIVNAVQRVSDILVQKSIKEGFGLTVTEALWKGRPVVASTAGGIPMQIKDGYNGYLVDPLNYDECADRVVECLKNPEHAEEMGRHARESVRENFLITRLLEDHLDLLTDLLS